MITSEQVYQLFLKTEALLEGHFELTSGLHSDKYFQCAKVLQYPWYAEELCQSLCEKLNDHTFDLVIAPAVGGVVIGYEMARLLKVRALFTERANGVMTLRRGFEIKPGEKALVMEDVTTTGGSVKEVLEVVRSLGADAQAVGALVDRSGGQVDFGIPYQSLMQVQVNTYHTDDCPLCATSSAIKPRSRSLSKS